MCVLTSSLGASLPPNLTQPIPGVLAYKPAARPYCCPDCGGREFWQLNGGRWLCCKCRPQPVARTQAAAAAPADPQPAAVHVAQHTLTVPSWYSCGADPQPAAVHVAQPAAPQAAQANLTVKFCPEIAIAANRRQCEVTQLKSGKVKRSFVSYAPAWRAWAVARVAAAAAGTSGDVAIETFYQAAAGAGIPRRSIERGVNQARALGWLRKVKGINRPDRFIIAGQKALALDTNRRPGKRQVEIPLSWLAGAGWRARACCTWYETINTQPMTILAPRIEREAGKPKVKVLPKRLNPISRKAQEELTGVDRYKAARYDRQAGVRKQTNWQLTDRPASEVSMFREHGKPAVAINGKVAIRKPDARELDGVRVSNFGKGKNILIALTKRGASIPPLSFSDGALSVRQKRTRIFCNSEKQAEGLANSIAKNGDPKTASQDIFLPAGYSRGGAKLWRLYLCL